MPISGAYADFVYLPERELVPVPAGLDAGEVVSLILNYITAYQMLHRSAKVRPGQRLLIHGRHNVRQGDTCCHHSHPYLTGAWVAGSPLQSASMRFSPDGRHLRFTLADDHDHTTSLWEASAAGENPRPLLPGWNTPASECCGTWTADGKYFVFQTTQNGRTDIWAIREQGRRFRWSIPRPRPLTSGPMSFFDPSSSEDGRELFVVGVQPRAEGPQDSEDS
jgi:hypothetical protein